MSPITRVLARYAAYSRYEAFPPAVKQEGLRAFVNWLGCAAGGACEDVVERMLGVLSEYNGGAQATVIGRPERLDPLNAAMINSLSSAALSFNDTHYATVAHPTSPVAAAALALAECRPVSGTELIHAIILGIELQCRVGAILCTPPAEVSVGLSMQGLVGGLGAAVAAGKLMAFGEDAMCAAIGHAVNQAAGLREAHATMGSPFTPGHMARCGLFAALLAERGVTINDTMLEGVKGFAVSYGSNANLEAAIGKLGETFEILSLAYKPYPSGFVTHPVIDVCLDITRNQTFDPTAIERVELAVNPLTIKLCNRAEPKDRAQAMVSFQHWAAVSLLYKAAGVAQVTEAMVQNAAVSALRLKIVADARDDIAREAAQARVVLRGGKVLEARIDQCIGSAGKPIGDEDITRKTRGQLQAVYSDALTERIIASAWQMPQAARTTAICALLRECS